MLKFWHFFSSKKDFNFLGNWSFKKWVFFLCPIFCKHFLPSALVHGNDVQNLCKESLFINVQNGRREKKFMDSFLSSSHSSSLSSSFSSPSPLPPPPRTIRRKKLKRTKVELVLLVPFRRGRGGLQRERRKMPVPIFFPLPPLPRRKIGLVWW